MANWFNVKFPLPYDESNRKMSIFQWHLSLQYTRINIGRLTQKYWVFFFNMGLNSYVFLAGLDWIIIKKKVL